jgi:hypothetical protein
MDKPYAHTLTPADRAFALKWLIGIVVFYGTIVLVVIGTIAADRYLGVPRPQQTAAVSLAAPVGNLTCAGTHPASGTSCSIPPTAPTMKRHAEPARHLPHVIRATLDAGTRPAAIAAVQTRPVAQNHPANPILCLKLPAEDWWCEISGLAVQRGFLATTIAVGLS